MGFPRLLPILTVSDLGAERAFYLAFGLVIEHEVEGFVAFTPPPTPNLDPSTALLFGLQEGAAELSDGIHPLDAHLLWQIETTDIDEVMAVAAANQFPIVQPLKKEPWGEWTCSVRSPNGIAVAFEGKRTADDQ